MSFNEDSGRVGFCRTLALRSAGQQRRFRDPSQRITPIGRTRVINCSGCYLFELEKDDE